MQRFGDFEWLHEELRIIMSGLIIPPLPEKNIFAKVFIFISIQKVGKTNNIEVYI